MVAPQEILRPEPFRVEIQKPEDIYTMIARSRLRLFHLFELKDKAERGDDVSEEQEEIFRSSSRDDYIELADASFTDGLYSHFNVHATPLVVPSKDRGLVTAFSLYLYGDYRNPEIHGKLSVEEAEQIHSLLTNIYGKSTRHFEVSTFNLFRVDDEYEQMKTEISLAYAHDSNVGKETSWLYMTLAHITNPPLYFHIDSLQGQHVLLGDQADFVRKIGKWAQCIEDTVRVVAQVKGVSQTGVLTLHPPERTET